MNKTYFRWLRILGILLFIWIASRVDWLSVWQLLRNAKTGYIIEYFFVFMMAAFLKVGRLWWFLRRLGYSTHFKEAYQSVIEPAFYGMVTPARVGEFSKILYLTRFGMSQGQAWSTVLFERLVDFSVLLIASIVGVLYFFVWDGQQIGWGGALFLGLSLCLYICLTNIRIFLELARICFGCFFLSLPDTKNILFGLQEKGRLSAHIFLPLALVNLLLSFTQLWLLGAGLGISVNGFYLGLAYASSSLVSLLPLSIAGLGTREAIYIALLAKQGISANAAIAISLLDGLVLSMLAQMILMLPLLRKSRHG
jgi:uncharacterized membrane protein YbhN (UPF0104 family)